MRTEKEQQQRNQELQRLKNASIGAEFEMGCIECEGLELHKKLKDGTWKCMNCGAKVIKL